MVTQGSVLTFLDSDSFGTAEHKTTDRARFYRMVGSVSENFRPVMSPRSLRLLASIMRSDSRYAQNALKLEWH